MSTKRKIITFVSIGVAVNALVIAVFVLAVLYLPTIMDAITPAVDEIKPEITYAEFPIRIEYTLYGEPKTAEDVLTCEFSGFEQTTWLEELNTGVAVYRIWDSKLKNNQDNRIILFTDGETTIDYSLGAPGYYVGDDKTRSFHYPSFRVFEPHPSGETVCRTFRSAEELEAYGIEKYGIEIGSCTLPRPIENSFGS